MLIHGTNKNVIVSFIARINELKLKVVQIDTRINQLEKNVEIQMEKENKWQKKNKSFGTVHSKHVHKRKCIHGIEVVRRPNDNNLRKFEEQKKSIVNLNHSLESIKATTRKEFEKLEASIQTVQYGLLNGLGVIFELFNLTWLQKFLWVKHLVRNF